MDLLDYARKLTASGNNQHARQLQALIQGKQPDSNSRKTSSLIGWLIVFGISTVVIGYLWMKGRKSQELED